MRAFPEALIEQEDVNNLVGGALLQRLGRRPGDIPLMLGGPPCQAWSSAGHQLGLHDPRGRLFEAFAAVAAECQVRWIVFENVRGLLTARGPDGRPGGALEYIRRRLLAHGFQTAVHLLNAADFGVPQRRVRLFIVGFAAGDMPPFPAPTHAGSGKCEYMYAPAWVTLGECLSRIGPCRPEDIIRPTVKLAVELASVPDGKGVRSPGKAEATRPGGHWGYKQGAFVADLDLPARTVTASGQQDWIRDGELGLRRLSPRECAAIQTFTPDWEFCGSRAAQYKLIGNAVPPVLAGHLADSLYGHAATQCQQAEPIGTDSLLPLPTELLSAIRYTILDNQRNGASRNAAPSRRRLPTMDEMQA